MTRARIAVLIAALVFATPVMAGPPAWRVDPAASKLGFRGSFGGDAFSGTFRRWTAQIAFDPKDLAHSSAVVTVDMTSARTGDADRDTALPTPDWFAAASFPRATFVSRVFKDLGGGRYQAIGDLSLRGVHKPVVLPFTLALGGAGAKVDGAAQLNRLDFGVGQGRWKDGDALAAQVTVTVDLIASRAH